MVENVCVLVEMLVKCGLWIVLGCMESYVMLVDLCVKYIMGKVVEVVFGVVYIMVNKNVILNDLEKLFVMSGICFGLLVMMMCGFGLVEVE